MLVWERPEPPDRPVPAPLSRERIVRAAMRLADADGLAVVSLRKVAAALDVGPMRLYGYLATKEELLDLMVDAVYLAMDRPAWRTRSWRRRLTRVAEANRAMFAAHPWVAEVATQTRPPLGPGLMAKYEYELSALDGTGLGDVETDAALTFVLGFVQTHGRATQAAARARAESEVDDTAWWEANASLLTQAFDEAAYPRAVRIGAAAGAAHGSAYSPEHAWAFGLARALDGLGALVDRRSGTARPRQR
jgi:AcrR family transcriptional regulator